MSKGGRKISSYWRKAIAVGCCLAALTLPAVAAAKTSAWLDPGFGLGGKLQIAFPEQPEGDGVYYGLGYQYSGGPLRMAAAGDGKVVIAGSTSLLQRLPDGRPDPAFGRGGKVVLPRSAGHRFELAGLVVDSRGRVLLAGSTRPLGPEGRPDAAASAVTLMRFLPDGKRDQTFGSGGILTTDFGLAPPHMEWAPSVHYPSPVVQAVDLAIDAEDRPVLGGTFVPYFVFCAYSHNSWPAQEAFVARFTTTGVLDPGFASGGLKRVDGTSTLSLPSGVLRTLTWGLGTRLPTCPRGDPPGYTTLSKFGPDGTLDPAFGANGFLFFPVAGPTASVLSPSGDLTLLGKGGPYPGGGKAKIVRVRPDGSFDPTFGRNGRVTLKLAPEYDATGLAVDGRGRVLVSGSELLKDDGSWSRLFLLRLLPNGRRDRSFNRGKPVSAGFGEGTKTTGDQVFVGDGKIMLGGALITPWLHTGGGFALARYRDGR